SVKSPIFVGVERILSIDYGKKRVGLAVSDPLQIIASGLDTIAPANLMDFLKNYFERETVSTIVVGYPLGLDGNATDATQMVEKLIVQLKKTFPAQQVVQQDERFTSVEAKKIILQSGVRKKRRRDKALVDKVSAVLILQDYLEANRQY
ncbi:MAG: Holliday junction resolvase RuvX, partial [Bacteroidota bacterium]